MKHLRLLTIVIVWIMPLLACGRVSVGRPTAQPKASPTPGMTVTKEVEPPIEEGEAGTDGEWYDDSYENGGSVGGYRVEFDGVGFDLHPELGEAEAERVPELTPDENDPLLEVYPEHIRFTLSGYPAPAGHMFPAQVFVYPTAAYEALLPELKPALTNFAKELKKRPAKPQQTLFLPRWNAGQIFRARVTYLDFDNGAVICMLNQWGQAASAINRLNMFYTCRGLTADGNYYVSAVFPVDAPGIGESYDDFGDYEVDYTAADFDEQYTDYLKDMADHLENLAPADFMPALDMLDELMMSLTVEAGG